MSEYSLSDLLFEYDKALLGFIADLAENALLQGQAGEIIDESNRRFRAVFDQSCEFLGLLSIDGKRLFQEIGRRLSDALTSLLILRDLKESEDKYRTLVQKIHAAVIVHGADTRILTCNPTAEKLLGLTEAQLLGKTAFDLDWHCFREDGTAMPFAEYPVNQVLAKRRPLRNFIVGILRPGEEKDHHLWTLVNADPVVGEDNRISQVIVTFIDITTRKRMERALKESEAKTRSILDNIDIGVALISPEMEILELNHRMGEWFPGVDPARRPICYRAFNSPPREMRCEYCPTCKGKIGDTSRNKILRFSTYGQNSKFGRHLGRLLLVITSFMAANAASPQGSPVFANRQRVRSGNVNSVKKQILPGLTPSLFVTLCIGGTGEP